MEKFNFFLGGEILVSRLFIKLFQKNKSFKLIPKGLFGRAYVRTYQCVLSY